MDLVIPNAFADDKLEYMIELWSDGYTEYLEDVDTENEEEAALAAAEEREAEVKIPMEVKDFAVMKVRNYLHAETDNKHRKKLAREGAKFESH